ncbi:MAG: enolase C-terminal domain-like protein [Candidatus Peribacteraceae bacterium]|nr:enolase C-terminal domain-like protein [Candidatus Peribacteraceae bacterium]
MHFREPFSIAYETVETADVVFVRLCDVEGRVGIGSGSPDPEVTGETLEMALESLQERLHSEALATPGSLYGVHAYLEEAFADSPSAQSAAEEALCSLLLQQNLLSFTDVLPPIRSACPATVTIGILEERATAEEVRRRLDEGFRSIKMKCGTDLATDLRKIQKSLALLPPDGSLLLDANQGYAMAEAVECLNALKDSGIVLIEQPVSAADLEGLRTLHHMQSIPVVADEAAVRFAGVKQLLDGDYAAGVNVKLMKCGGLLNAERIIRYAKEHDKIVLIGCMYESNVSLTTAAHIALAFEVDVADIDSGNMDFDDDPATGGFRVQDGYISVGYPLRVSL